MRARLRRAGAPARRLRRLLGRRVALACAAGALVSGGLATVEVVDAGAAVGPALSVDATAGQQPISPYIYGIATGSSTALGEAMRLPIQRWGGDATTRYDWQYDTTESGGDFYFIGGAVSGHSTPGYTTDADELRAQQSGGTMLMTIPIGQWVAGPSALDCSFPTPPYPPQSSYSWAVWLPDGAKCGADDDAPTINWNWVDTDIGATDVPNSPALQEAWVQHLVSTFGSAAHGGVAVYEMDNEPGGWDNTHRDVHPDMTGWDELVGDTETYASVVKTADPSAQIDGPGDFAYWDNGGLPNDGAGDHSPSPMAAYYLQQIAAYQQSPAWQDAHPGEKVIDYFDEHFYPSAPAGVDCIGLCAADPSNEQARLDSTCELWESSCSVNGSTENVGIIPILKSWIAKYDPGIPPAISEYDWGGHESINGALAEADVLGIFGAQGVGLASMWDVPGLLANGDPQPVVFSFEMYRNYDGEGDGFGDTSVQATSGGSDNSGQNELSVYAATRSSDGALTVMVINKTANDLTSPLSITGFPGASEAGATAQVYTYDSANLGAVVRQPDLDLSTGSATFPADSITLLVVPPTSAAGATAPGAPAIDSVATADGAATVTFTPPASDGGSPITSYTVTATNTTSGATAVGYGSSSPVVVPGLDDGQSYTFSVAATNLAGTTSSSPSGPSTLPTTTTTTSPPSTPPPHVTTTTVLPPSTTTSTTTIPAGGGGSSPVGQGAGASTTTSTIPLDVTTTSEAPGGSSVPLRHRQSRPARSTGLAVDGVLPERLVVGGPLRTLRIAGRGFRGAARVTVRFSGRGVRLKRVRVLSADELVLRIRATRFASPGRRSILVTVGSRRAICRRCLDVVPAPRR